MVIKTVVAFAPLARTIVLVVILSAVAACSGINREQDASYGHLPPPNPKGLTYNFRVKEIEAVKIRSQMWDTVTLVFSVKVGDTVYGPVTKQFGDKGTGAVMPRPEKADELWLGAIPDIKDDTPIVVGYAVNNQGYENNAKREQMAKKVLEWIFKGAAGELAPLVPIVESYNSQNCDMPLATDSYKLTGKSLANELATSDSKSYPKPHPGKGSGTGGWFSCQPTFLYNVTWEVKKEVK